MSGLTVGRVDLGELVPSRDDYAHALRVAAALAIPGAVLLALGRPELLLYAVFGSFSGMYGRLYGGRMRTVQQVRGAVLLVAGVTCGVTLSQAGAPAWVLVVVEVVFAAVASVFADRWRLRPAGPFFAIFALGATALVPAMTIRPEPAIALCVATAALGVLFGRIGTSGLAGPVLVRMGRRDSLVHALRYALAIGGAGGVALTLGFTNPNWAMAAAAVPLAAIDSGRVGRSDVRAVLARAGHRIAGTYAGLVLSAVLLLVHPSPVVLGLTVMLLLFPTELFMGRNYGVAIGFFTPLILVMTELGSPGDPWHMLVTRGVDTLIGVVMGVAAALLVRGLSPRAEPVDDAAAPS